MADFRKLARRAALKHGIDPDVFERQINQESGFNPHALSPAGARGIAQFEPATARGLGINPDNPEQALNGAAQLMASYVRKYGSYRDALVAYNAGPGRVGRSLLPETQNYIANILGGHEPTSRPRATSMLASQAASGGSVPTAGGTEPDTVRLTLARLLAGQGQDAHNNPLFATGLLSTDPSQMTRPTQVASPASTPSYVASATPVNGGGTGHLGKPNGLFELFWQGAGGIDVKNGQVVPQGFVEGHQDHVHIAASARQILALGHMAQALGLRVGENPAFGGVNPVHATNSYHYHTENVNGRKVGEAIDVSGRPALERKFAHLAARKFGIR